MAKRIPQKRFEPKPFEIGSTVTVEGRVFTIQSHGPESGTRWGVDEAGTWDLLQVPAKRRPAAVVPTGLPGVTHGDWAQQALGRAEVVRHGVAVHGDRDRERVIHARTDCPQAAGRKMDSRFGMHRAALRELHEILAYDDPVWEREYAPVESTCPCVSEASRDLAGDTARP
ncbi:hypothetical protein LG293_16710 (plasmid) [Citricoccus nitrophenolicus]